MRKPTDTLARDSRTIDSHLQQATSLLQSGALEDAERRLAELLSEWPGSADAHRTMALLASRTGRQSLALQHMADATRLAPERVEYQFQLGCLQAHTGQPAAALANFIAVTTRSPGYSEGWYLRGATLRRMGRDAEALPVLRQARLLAPTDPKVTTALAEAEFKAGYPADAIKLWQDLLEQQPDDIHVRLRTGETLSRLGHHDRAIELYRHGLRQRPEDAEVWLALAQACEDMGDRKSAREAYSTAMALRPGWAFPLSGLLGLASRDPSDDLMKMALTLQESASLSDQDRALLGYELGKIHDARGRHDLALASWHSANAARRRMTGVHEPDELARRAERTVATFSRKMLEAHAGLGSDDCRFVFVVGMPRSGTTLTEQIIAQHPQTFGCGELPDIALIVNNLPRQIPALQPWPEAAANLDRSALATAVKRYTEAATRLAPAEATRLIDKAPLNFFHLGLIALMFPQSRVIWCRRHPCDIAISIYAENFALDEKQATSFESIGHYINAQNRLMRHWQDVLSIPILESSYEGLTAAPEAQAKRLIEFVGLAWDPACLRFHESNRGVQTPSRWQVRQPMHTRSVGRWRHYEADLAPLLEVLDHHDRPSSI